MNNLARRPLGLTWLRSFEAVARHLNFSAAADEMSVTQSAISRQIKALEDEIGAALFTRGTRHVELTQKGQTLLRAVQGSLPAIDAAVRQIRASRGRPQVNVTTFASFGSLCPLLAGSRRSGAQTRHRKPAARGVFASSFSSSMLRAACGRVLVAINVSFLDARRAGSRLDRPAASGSVEGQQRVGLSSSSALEAVSAWRRLAGQPQQVASRVQRSPGAKTIKQPVLAAAGVWRAKANSGSRLPTPRPQ